MSQYFINRPLHICFNSIATGVDNKGCPRRPVSYKRQHGFFETKFRNKNGSLNLRCVCFSFSLEIKMNKYSFCMMYDVNLHFFLM